MSHTPPILFKAPNPTLWLSFGSVVGLELHSLSHNFRECRRLTPRTLSTNCLQTITAIVKFPKLTLYSSQYHTPIVMIPIANLIPWASQLKTVTLLLLFQWPCRWVSWGPHTTPPKPTLNPAAWLSWVEHSQQVPRTVIPLLNYSLPLTTTTTDPSPSPSSLSPSSSSPLSPLPSLLQIYDQKDDSDNHDWQLKLERNPQS